jgi:hypothetical protein
MVMRPTPRKVLRSKEGTLVCNLCLNTEGDTYFYATHRTLCGKCILAKAQAKRGPKKYRVKNCKMCGMNEQETKFHTKQKIRTCMKCYNLKQIQKNKVVREEILKIPRVCMSCSKSEPEGRWSPANKRNMCMDCYNVYRSEMRKRKPYVNKHKSEHIVPIRQLLGTSRTELKQEGYFFRTNLPIGADREKMIESVKDKVRKDV